MKLKIITKTKTEYILDNSELKKGDLMNMLNKELTTFNGGNSFTVIKTSEIESITLIY